MREIIFDTETTGLSPQSGHRVVEIGCVEMVHKVRTGKNFHTYINPLRDMPKEAEAVHGISGDFLLDKPVFADVVEDFLNFLGEDSILVAHNASFDMRFINHEFESHGYRSVSDERVIDTLAITRQKFPGSPASLDALCRRFDVDLSRREKHGALLDAELLAEVYIELCGGKQVGIDFHQEQAEDIQEAASTNHQVIEMRPHPISKEELEAHQELVTNINSPIWAEYAE